MRLGFVDVDDQVQERCGVDIPWIFDIEGEPGFRRRESEILAECAELSDVVIATGAGIVLAEANRELMQSAGLIVYLKTTVERQLARLRNDKRRPLLMAPDRRQRLEDMARIRSPLYESIADVTVVSEQDSLPRMTRKVTTAIRQHQTQHITDENH